MVSGKDMCIHWNRSVTSVQSVPTSPFEVFHHPSNIARVVTTVLVSIVLRGGFES